jgi:hypothetical protein
MPRSFSSAALRRLALAGLLLGLLPAAAAPMGSARLRDTQAALAAEMREGSFAEPLVIRSSEQGGRIEGHAFAQVDVPFARLAQSITERAQWCPMLMLHLNNKYCRQTQEGGTPRVELYVGRKSEQPVRSATRLRFAWVPSLMRGAYAAAELAAPDGPYDTRDYDLVVEAVPLDERRSFVHLGYAFSHAGASRLAMRLYLATVGRDKVGFSREAQPGGGAGPLVGGMRGVVERNVMRYLLALRCHAQGAAADAGTHQDLDTRLRCWFDATERYAPQLHELDERDYLHMKQAEFARLDSTP